MYLGGEQVRSRDVRRSDPAGDRRGGRGLLREAEERALALLTEHRDALDRLVEDLLAHETVTGDVVREIASGRVSGATRVGDRAPQPADR